MASSPGHEYTLVGFSEELDRRPLVFVKPLPSAKVCSACGLVPKAIALHQCEHWFCKPCYEQCVRRGEVVCPHDGEACLEDEVTWINYKAERVMTKQVLCWNHRHGCNVVTAAADISRHFHHECVHHSARCPKCSAEILSSGVCGHLESRSEAAREARAAGGQQGTVPQERESAGEIRSENSSDFRQMHNVISTYMSSIQAELKEISRTLKFSCGATPSGQDEAREGNLGAGLLQDSLNQMRIQTAELKDHLDEFMQNVYANQQTLHNNIVETNEAFKLSLTDTELPRIIQSERAAQLAAFREAVGDGQRQTKADLDRLSLAIDRKLDRMSELLQSGNARQESRSESPQETADAHTEGLAQDVSKIAWAQSSTPEDRRNALALFPATMRVATTHTWTFEGCESPKELVLRLTGQPVYMRGYYLSVGDVFRCSGEIYFICRLHKGEVDRYLEWPFNLHVRLSLLHPEDGRKVEFCMTPNRVEYFKQQCLRPEHEHHGRLLAYSTSLTMSSLKERGFIKDGRIRLRVSLEDPPDEEEP